MGAVGFLGCEYSCDLSVDWYRVYCRFSTDWNGIYDTAPLWPLDFHRCLLGVRPARFSCVGRARIRFAPENNAPCVKIEEQSVVRRWRTRFLPVVVVTDRS